ncbi:hypothetical protein AB835_06730 [Candidatus Endobugula sertula]|uniref:CDP-diglyceride synthetase n=1 Tax=Candidatus Endobugula sertula TaxID=62101 RepID=A0A1D2QQM5_9GAMM|nr:hypothetical protein AB835_06730 [Candidatus Endobugula sertula]
MALTEPTLNQWLIQLLMLAFPALGAGVLHMAVVKWNIAPWLKKPLDGGYCWRGKRIFGDHKTYRGVIAMVLLSTLFCYLLMLLVHHSTFWQTYHLLEFDRYPPWFYGMIYGLAYTLSELPNSFIKRQQNITPGNRGSVTNILIDQSDSIVGCLLAIYPFVSISFTFILLGIIFLSVIHIVTNLLLFLLNLREQPL